MTTNAPRTIPMTTVAQLLPILSAVDYYMTHGHDDFTHQLDNFTDEGIRIYHILTHPSFQGDPDRCTDCIDDANRTRCTEDCGPLYPIPVF